MQHGFVRVGTASPRVRVADCRENARRIVELLKRAEQEGVVILVFPELCLTGYTCADLFQQSTLQSSALTALQEILLQGQTYFSGVFIVGLPLQVDNALYNCAAVLHQGKIQGIVPKTHIPNYKEFYEVRWFSSSRSCQRQEIQLLGQNVPFGTNLLFEARQFPDLVLGVEICEDLWMPVPPSSFHALQGATVLANLSASNDIIGKAVYRKDLVYNQSGRCVAGYLYAAANVQESTTDLVFGGHSMIAENARILAEAERFQRQDVLQIADLDLQNLRHDRAQLTPFSEGPVLDNPPLAYRRLYFDLKTPLPAGRLRRFVDGHPFVPRGQEKLNERCEEIFHLQVAGLASRLEHIGKPNVAIGISGGLDSTLALLVTCKTFDLLGVGRGQIQALTMPGFGTSSRTLKNATALMLKLGVSAREIDIRPQCLEQMKALRHNPFALDLRGLAVEEFTQRLQEIPDEKRADLVFENVQARMRTSLLMNTGFVIGTGDVSELALGWCTYNADHMSMYNPNVSIPKTLVKFLVRWVANFEYADETRKILLDIVDTKISPELLPTDAAGEIGQCTESVIGPYELHDFFLYHFLRFGSGPEKILFLAEHAEFDRPYSPEEIRKWLKVFLKRFFANQFKRSCLPDGPKVGSISLSPRGDWRMPSDAAVSAWLEWAEK
ncbi:MAG: NAD(+) synthase [Bdellovibrionales bacterium]